MSDYISRQIVKYATSGKLIEFTDKLNLPPVTTYAHVQANGDKDDKGKGIYSNIGITVLDYSKGTGDKTVSVEANISSDDLMYVFEKLKIGLKNFQLPPQDKIFGEPDADGKSKVTKLLIKREHMKGEEESKYPWYIQIENGVGIKAINTSTGGTYIKSGSYKCEAKVGINLTDLDMYRMLSRVQTYVSVWELTFAPRLVRFAKEQMAHAGEENG